jgi:hypothetical protein
VVAQTLSLGKTRNYPSFATVHGVAGDPADHVIHHIVPDTRGRRRPRFPDQGLQFGGVISHLSTKSFKPTPLQGLHHMQVRDPVVYLQVGQVQRGTNTLQRLGPHGQHLE